MSEILKPPIQKVESRAARRMTLALALALTGGSLTSCSGLSGQGFKTERTEVQVETVCPNPDSHLISYSLMPDEDDPDRTDYSLERLVCNDGGRGKVYSVTTGNDQGKFVTYVNPEGYYNSKQKPNRDTISFVVEDEYGYIIDGGGEKQAEKNPFNLKVDPDALSLMLDDVDGVENLTLKNS